MGEYAIPKIKMLCNLYCLKVRLRLLCNELSTASSLNLVLRQLSYVNILFSEWRIETVPPQSQIKELPKGDFLIIGDSVQDVIILQSESEMEAALGKNVKVSLPKAFQTNKVQTNKRSSNRYNRLRVYRIP